MNFTGIRITFIRKYYGKFGKSPTAHRHSLALVTTLIRGFDVVCNIVNRGILKTADYSKRNVNSPKRCNILQDHDILFSQTIKLVVSFTKNTF